MEQETGNKIIAEFMDVKPYYKGVLGDTRLTYQISESKIAFEGEFEYHTSWDWQVPVWGKAALVVKELIPHLPDAEETAKWYFRLVSKYEQAVFQNKPEEGQQIIVELITWYDNQKVK